MNSTTTNAQVVVVVDAPDGTAARALEQRLLDLAPSAIAEDSHWCVQIEVAEDLISELTASVRSWLRELGTEEAEMRVDGRAVRVRARNVQRRLRWVSHERFIG